MSILKYFQRNKRPIPITPYLSIGGVSPPNWNQSSFLQAYGEIGWLHAVVFRIALGCSEVEWTLFDTSNQDKPKQIFKHPILSLLHQVNPFQTSNEFIALDTIYNELIGESFWALNFNALGEPAEIILPYPQKMSVVPDKSFPFVKGYVYGVGADAVPFDVNEIIHFKYPNPLNQYHGLAPANAIGVNLDAEKNADKWVNQFFYNSARPDGVIQFDYNLSDEQFEKLKKQWQEKYKGVSKAHQVALLEGGGKYIQIQNTIKDMDFPNLKDRNREVILGVWGMPAGAMGISRDVNKANVEAADYQFARWLIKPRLDWKKSKIQEQLIPKFRRSENLKIDFQEVVPKTIEQKVATAESGMRAGYLTINEARKMQGYDPLPNGDVLLVPLNLIPTPVSGKVSTPKPTEEPMLKGGEGSGNFGHEGRPGETGGSGEGGGISVEAARSFIGSNSEAIKTGKPKEVQKLRNQYLKEQGYSKEEIAELDKMQDGWMRGVYNPNAQNMRQVATEDYGRSWDNDEYHDDMPKTSSSPSERASAIVRENRAFASETIRAKYGDEITVYRGVRGDQAESIRGGIESGQSVDLGVNSISSWSISPKGATRFAETGIPPGMVVQTKIRASDVWGAADTSSNFSLGEKEIVVGSRTGRIPVSAKSGKSKTLIVAVDDNYENANWIEGKERKKKSKGLDDDQKRIHWEAYAKKTERQGEVFKRVFENVFNEQKNLVIAEIERTGQLPPLNDEQTAKKFEPALSLVYEDAFESTV